MHRGTMSTAHIESHSSRAPRAAPINEFGFPEIDVSTLHVQGKPLPAELQQPEAVFQEMESTVAGSRRAVLDVFGMSTEFARMTGIPTERARTPFAHAFPGMYTETRPGKRIRNAEERRGVPFPPAERSMLLQYLYQAPMPPVVKNWEAYKARVEAANDRSRDTDTLHLHDDMVRVDFAAEDRRAAARHLHRNAPHYPIDV